MPPPLLREVGIGNSSQYSGVSSDQPPEILEILQIIRCSPSLFPPVLFFPPAVPVTMVGKQSYPGTSLCTRPSIMLVCVVGLADDHSGGSEASAGGLAVTFSSVPFHKDIFCQCLLVAKVGSFEV